MIAKTVGKVFNKKFHRYLTYIFYDQKKQISGWQYIPSFLFLICKPIALYMSTFQGQLLNLYNNQTGQIFSLRSVSSIRKSAKNDYIRYLKSGDHLYASALPTCKQSIFVEQILIICIEKRLQQKSSVQFPWLESFHKSLPMLILTMKILFYLLTHSPWLLQNHHYYSLRFWNFLVCFFLLALCCF